MAGWVKLNSDAAVTNHGAKAATGGVVRDSDGNFILGYASDIGEATTTVAELQAILMGLKLVWRRGFTKVTMETDSLTSVCLIQGDVRVCIHALLRCWRFKAIYRGSKSVISVTR